LGEDACLLEEEEGYKISDNEHEDMQGDPKVASNVDILVDKIV